MIKIGILTVFVLILSSCSIDPQRQTRGGVNATLLIEELGSGFGCTIYRFTDDGAHHYFTVCSDHEMISTQSLIRQGKTTSTEEIKTELIP